VRARLVAIAEWAADRPGSLANTLGTGTRCPSESTIRRVVSTVDADVFDTVIGGFVQRLSAALAPAGRRRVLAVDGKTLRGSRHTDRGGDIVAGRHLLAVIDQHTRVVLGQLNVEGKTRNHHRWRNLPRPRRSRPTRRYPSHPKSDRRRESGLRRFLTRTTEYAWPVRQPLTYGIGAGSRARTCRPTAYKAVVATH
jgi:hypothetical protein